MVVATVAGTVAMATVLATAGTATVVVMAVVTAVAVPVAAAEEEDLSANAANLCRAAHAAFGTAIAVTKPAVMPVCTGVEEVVADVAAAAAVAASYLPGARRRWSPAGEAVALLVTAGSEVLT